MTAEGSGTLRKANDNVMPAGFKTTSAAHMYITERRAERPTEEGAPPYVNGMAGVMPEGTGGFKTRRGAGRPTPVVRASLMPYRRADVANVANVTIYGYPRGGEDVWML